MYFEAFTSICFDLKDVVLAAVVRALALGGNRRACLRRACFTPACMSTGLSLHCHDLALKLH